VDRARIEERSIVRTWAMRSTMHLLATEDIGWVLPLFEPASRGLAPPSGAARARCEFPGQSARGLTGALEADGYLGRTELVERLGQVGIEIDAARRVHLFRLATGEGLAILGPDRGAETLLALASDWVGDRPPHDATRRSPSSPPLPPRLRPGDRGRFRGLVGAPAARRPRRRSVTRAAPQPHLHQLTGNTPQAGADVAQREPRPARESPSVAGRRRGGSGG